MVLLSVLETEAETKLKAALSNQRALMMEMEDKLGGVLGDSSPASKHVC